MARVPSNHLRVAVLAVAALAAGLQSCRDGRQIRHVETRIETTVGEIGRVDDGDTVTLADGRKVRYLGIDTPERGEPFSKLAKSENQRLVAGKTIQCRPAGPSTTDGYGRYLGIVSVVGGNGAAERNVNAALVRAGLASVYRTSADSIDEPDFAILLEAQRTAIAEHRGFWPERLARAKELREPLVATRLRIHRQSCAEIRSHGLSEVASLESELREGKSFCRVCKPLGDRE